ncbi:MAG: DUF305 domain-containing protein [Agromyces sp.]
MSQTPLRRRFLPTLAMAGLLAVGVSGCTLNFNGFGTSNMMGSGTSMMAGAGNYSTTDLMFAAMMIPHHQQAVEMSELALKVSSNADVRALAQQIKDAQQPEIDQMKSWLAGSAYEAMATSMPGMDHGMMDGMLSEEQISALAAATGVDFDKLFLQGMILHHQGAIAMASMVTSSSNAEAKALGDAIVKSQTAEIETMQQLLTSLG